MSEQLPAELREDLERIAKHLPGPGLAGLAFGTWARDVLARYPEPPKSGDKK